SRDMNRPIGFVASRISPKNARIWKTPTVVITASELLRLEHRPAEIHKQEDRNRSGNDVVEHRRPLSRALARFGDAPHREKTNQPREQIEQWPTSPLLIAGDSDKPDKLPRRFEQAPQPMRAAARPPALTAREHDQRMRLECPRNRLAFVAAQIHAHTDIQPFF